MADEHPDASEEAREALRAARHAKASTDAVLPVISRQVERVRAMTDANHFSELFEAGLSEAAKRGQRK